MVYILIRTEDAARMVELVGEKLKEGFKPQGGVSVAISHGDGYYETAYAQAMIKE